MVRAASWAALPFRSAPVEAAVAASPLRPKYEVALDRHSAYEVLTARLAPPPAPSTPTAAPRPTPTAAPQADWPSVPSYPEPPRQPPVEAPADEGGFLSDLAENPAVKSFWRSLGTAVGGAVGRSITGTRRRRR